MKKYVLGLLMVLFLTAPLYAGMEPFYKGEWGMSPAEINALNNNEPAPGHFSKFYRTYEFEYLQKLYDQTVAVSYIFDKDKKLVATGVYDYRINDSSSHVLWEFMDELTDTFNNTTNESLDYAQKLTDAENAHYYELAWINTDIFIYVYVDIKPGESLSDYTFYFKFYDNANNVYQKDFDRIKAANQ